MRVLIVTQWFDPEPTFKGLTFARGLAALGHEVEVVTGFPNYPSGKLYPGYRVRWHQHERVDGVDVHRVPLYPSHDKSALRRVANYVSFALSAATIGVGVVKRPDVVYVYHPPGSVAVPALAFGAVHDVPVVYDVQDLWPESLKATGMLDNPVALRTIAAVLDVMYANAAAIVVLAPGMKKKLVERGVDEKKVHVIYNWCDEASMMGPHRRDEALKHKLGMSGKFNVVYAGNLGRAQALQTVISAAAILSTTDPDVQFTFIGNGLDVENLKQEVSRQSLRNVQFHPHVPQAEIGRTLAQADALLVHLKHDPLFAFTIPSKTQAYMAAGKPVIISVEGDAADLVRRAESGYICRPEQPEDIVASVRSLLAMSPQARTQMGENAARFYREHLSMKKGVSEFDKLFRSLVRRPGDHAASQPASP